MNTDIPTRNESDSEFPASKKQTGKWILFGFLIIIFSIIYFFVMNLENFPELKELQLWIKLLIYIFITVIFFGPFIPIKRRGGKRVSIVNSLVRMIEGPQKRRFKPKPQSNLNVEYKPPLISSCKCGFLLTRQMAKCPNCQKANRYYVPKE